MLACMLLHGLSEDLPGFRDGQIPTVKGEVQRALGRLPKSWYLYHVVVPVSFSELNF